MEFAKRMDCFGEGIFSKLAEIRRRKEAAGEEVIDLSIGAPNIPPAPHVMQALCEAAADPASYVYAISDKRELLEAVAAWYKRRYGVELVPEREICSLLGSQEGLSHIALSIADPGDVVLAPDPCYPVFADGPRIAGADIYYMPQKKENGWVIRLSDIPEDVARKAKLMVVSYPNNPTAVMAPESFYEELVAFAKKYDIIVLHDNAYSELVFDGKTCGSFLAYPGAKEVGVEFNSLSKTYGLAGARIGFCLGNEQVVSKLKLLKSNMDYGMFLPLLPTTPFLLLTAALYIKGSPRLYDWLISHRILGEYIRNFRENRAIPLHAKIISVSLLWATMLYCIFAVVDKWIWAQLLLAALAAAITWHILSFATLRK